MGPRTGVAIIPSAMPTYEYRCSSCGRTFEVVQSFSDAPLTTCEVCSGELKRVFHPVGILLKGSGFYSTDNRSSKSLTPTKKDGAGSSDSSSDTSDSSSDPSDSGSSSSKPETKKKAETKKTDPASGSAAP